MRLPWILLSLWTFIATTSCTAPAKLKRLSHEAHSGDDTLGGLMTEALTAADEADSAHALGHLVARWKEEGRAPSDVIRDESTGQSYRVRLESGHTRSYPLTYFDDLSPAVDYEVKCMDHHQRAGVGAPLVALRENREQEPLERFFPPEAITRPVTAVATAGKTRAGITDVDISLLCPLIANEVTLAGERQALAADFSVPWAALLERSGALNRSRVLDALRPVPKRKPQLYLMEPYDSRKEPLIMIHGLFSTPLAWAAISNDLWADDEIRHRYQIWHYLYNTSAPALYSARLLRTQLAELRTLLDPEGDDPAMQRTTLLMHSMGGIVGKAMMSSPGEVFWKAAFNVPPESLKLTAEDRDTLDHAFEWQADPTIHRAIFICVPHRGSSFADNLLGRIGRWLVGPPTEFREFYERVSTANPGAFTPEYEALGQGKLDSVNALSPRQPTLRILADLPFAYPAEAYSIIGNRGRSGPLEKSSDGIVPYHSSHLSEARSEKIIPDGHGAFRHPEAVAEVQRILKLQ